MDPNSKLALDLRRWIEALTMRSLYAWRKFVKDTGLSVPQFGVLVRLYHDGPCDMRTLREHLEISSAGVSQLVDRLVQGGLLARFEDPQDRRVRRLVLTAEGCSLVERSNSERFRWVDALLAGLNPEEREMLGRVLPSLIAAEGRLGMVSNLSGCSVSDPSPAIKVPKETP